jgi:hypothetical protein
MGHGTWAMDNRLVHYDHGIFGLILVVANSESQEDQTYEQKAQKKSCPGL